eukprot:GEMP01003760.1.p1 GENE.GEMP01003760.1~~GEMP01003760.1.p1  ORF type:complete len:903 (+),score=216.32 GEMP01003760.1:357-3065(+)
MDPYEEFGLTIRRDINCLSESDRTLRRTALVKLEKALRSERKVEEAFAVRAFQEELHKPLLRLLGDKGEKCRELSLDLLNYFIQKLPLAELKDLLPLILAGVLQRIRILPFPEPSEEIRMEILRVVGTILDVSEKLIAPFTHDIVDALAKALTDPCPDSKKTCCALVTRLTSLTDPERLTNCCAPLLQSLVQTLRHQHWKVRKAALDSLKDILCSAETFELLSDLLPHLAAVLSDRTPQVRICLSNCLQTWLLRGLSLRWPGKPPDFDNLDAEMDFDKYEHRLLYLLVSTAADEDESVAEVGFANLELVAVKAEEKRRADKEATKKDDDDAMGVDDGNADSSDVPPPPLEMMSNISASTAPWYKCPSADLSTYIYRFYHKLLRPVMSKILEWTSSQQVSASRFLRILLGLAPHGIPPYLELILVHMYRASLVEIFDAATMIGLFVPMDLVVDLVVQQLGLRGAGNPSNFGVNEVVGRVTCRQVQSMSNAKNFVANSTETKLQVLQIFHTILKARPVECESLAHQILALLDSQAQHDELHEETLQCVEALVTNNAAWIAKLWDEVFDIALLVMMTPALNARVDKLLDQVATEVGQPLSELYATHLEAHMSVLMGEQAVQHMWADNSPNAHILDTLLRRSSPKAVANFGVYFQRLVPVLACQCSPEATPNRRCDLLGLVHHLLTVKHADLLESIKPTALGLVMDVLIPNAIWRPGQSNNKIRKGALVCIHAALEAQLLEPSDLVDRVLPNLFPLIKSAMDDAWSPDNRLIASMVLLRSLANLVGAKHPVSDQYLREIYPELLKRLDDSNDEIRKKVCETFSVFFRCLPERWSDSLYEYILHALFIHLDDPNPALQSSVYSALEAALHYNVDKFIHGAQLACSKASHPRRYQDLVRLAESLKMQD